MNSCLFRFALFTLDPRKRLLMNDGVTVALGPKVIETLSILVESAGELVTKATFMERLWPGRFVEEANLTQNIYRLRQVLSSAGLGGAIETMACRGYRFIVPVEHVDSGVAEHQAISAFVVEKRKRWHRWFIAASAAACGSLFLITNASRPAVASAYARLSPESQRLYALGRYHWNLRSDRPQIKVSLRDFQEVAKRDPDNPLGYSGLADAYLAIFDTACNSSVVGCKRIVALANASAREAVEKDPESAEAHTSLAMALNEFTHDHVRSDAEFARAIQLDDNYALAHHWYGNSLLVRGLIGHATQQHREALALEPTSPATYAWLADDAYFNRRYSDAISYARESLSIYPNRHATRVLLGLAYEQLGNERAADEIFNHLPRVERDALVAELLARSGKRAAAIAALRHIGRQEADTSGASLDIAFAWLALGDRSLAYSFLNARPQANYIDRGFLALEPRLDAVRTDPRFRRWTAPDEN